jgi:hypothetical protein
MAMQFSKRMTLAMATLGLALAASIPQPAHAADNGESDLIRTGCAYSIWPVVNQSIFGQFPVQLWHSGTCNTRWASTTLNSNASQSWRPASRVDVFMISNWDVTARGARYYSWTGPGNYFSTMMRAQDASAPCGVLRFTNQSFGTNCGFVQR